MNELEARRLLLADPHRLSPELQSMVDASPRLGELREELIRADDRVRDALTSTAVPAGLADRIVLNALHGNRSRWGLALAAAVVAAAIAVPWTLREPETGLERAMIEHVDRELAELEDNRGIEPALLRVSVAAFGIDVRDAGYRVRHLANCIVAGREGRHFTVDGPNGVVSFVVLPAQDPGGDAGVPMPEAGTR